MSKERNALWQFLASVKLALASIFLLTATSIIGTVIQQGKAPEFYVQEYGATVAGVFQLLDITNMYTSWWFLALLAVFAVNLIVCSIERLPATWRMMMQDQGVLDPQRLEKMSSTHRAETDLPIAVTTQRMQHLLERSGWKRSGQVHSNGSSVLFAQRGAWTRLGSQIVHLSILVIIAGAAAGSLFGYKAYIFLPEGRSTSNVFLQKDQQAIPLDFELYYDRHERSHYPDGSVQEYRSALTVYDPERSIPYEKTSVVNDPLQYKGLSFYIADNYPLEEYLIQIRHPASGAQQAFRIPPHQQVEWPGTDIVFSIEELRQDVEGATHQAMIRFFDGTDADPSVFWISNRDTVTIERPQGDFAFSARQLYTTLFLVTKDPGVAVVYLGFTLMVIGLCVSFFLSHQRIWITVASTQNQGSRILVSGTANKHLPAFERRFRELVAGMEQEAPMAARAPKAAKPLKKRRMAA